MNYEAIMKKVILIPVLLAFLLNIGITDSRAQATKYTLSPESTMMVEGTSTIHDWECKVETLNLDAMLNPAVLSDSESGDSFVQALSFSAPVESIECGKNAMNNKTHDALKKDKFPTISFNLKDAAIQENTASDSLMLNVTGDLTLAGVTKTVTFEVKGQTVNNGFAFTGEYKLNMTDYEMDPPTAVFGTIRAGEEVTVLFDVKLTSNQL